ncbi:hypothetical protein DRP04_07650 [Archaeoglobales archaeon]|nr:MAG: hypothetical protein DRP04_07650 [Archaeoglobales archaeon]
MGGLLEVVTMKKKEKLLKGLMTKSRHRYDFGEGERAYDLNRPQYKVAWRLLEEVDFSKIRSVADVGAGFGEFSDMLLERFPHLEIVCFDGDLNCYNALKDRYESYLIDFDTETVDERFRKKFDLVLALEVIEHLRYPQNLLDIIKFILKDGGWVMITTQNYNFWVYRLYHLLGKGEVFLTSGRHFSFFTRNSLKMLLEANGFKIVKECGFSIIPKVRYKFLISRMTNFLAEDFGFLLRKLRLR